MCPWRVSILLSRYQNYVDIRQCAQCMLLTQQDIRLKNPSKTIVSEKVDLPE